MYVPRSGKARDDKVLEIMENCRQGIEDRRILYDRRRRWLFYGNVGDQPVRYNRLAAHTDLVCSFLYNPEHVRLSMSMPSGALPMQRELAEPSADYVAKVLGERGILHSYDEALFWSLIYDSMFLKLGWNSGRGFLTCKIVEPHSFGVYDEAEGDLEDQEAFSHTYTLDWNNAVRRIARAGHADKIKLLSPKEHAKDDEYPTVVHNLVISTTGGSNLLGPVVGQARAEEGSCFSYRSASTHKQVRFTEIYVWDDNRNDYAIFTVAGEDIFISDSRETIATLASVAKLHGKKFASETNTFLPQEHPFVEIKPYVIYDYFWGEASSERGIPLQNWTNERLEQIDRLLKKQVDPSKIYSGFSGLQIEKEIAMRGPGAAVYDQTPGSKVQELTPDLPPDLFVEFREIGEMFLETAGLTKTVAGQGAEGVRSGEHAKGLVVTGSGRIRKTALKLEKSLSRLGELAMKLLAHNDDEPLKTKQGREFMLSQVEGEWSISVSGHSHSPLFSGETKETANDLLKAKAIDRESYIKLRNPPGVDTLVDRLKKIEQKEQQAAMMGMAEPGGKEQHERMRSHHGAHEKG